MAEKSSVQTSATAITRGSGQRSCARRECRVHYARNLLAVVPKGSQEMVAAAFRSIFALGTQIEI